MTVLEVKHQGKLQEWQERIMECRSSGKSVKLWCEEQGISVTTYYRWEREIFGSVGRRKGDLIPVARSTPVFAEYPVEQTGERGGMQPRVTVHSGGMTVDIYSGADKEMVESIIQAMKTC